MKYTPREVVIKGFGANVFDCLLLGCDGLKSVMGELDMHPGPLPPAGNCPVLRWPQGGALRSLLPPTSHAVSWSVVWGCFGLTPTVWDSVVSRVGVVSGGLGVGRGHRTVLCRPHSRGILTRGQMQPLLLEFVLINVYCFRHFFRKRSRTRIFKYKGEFLMSLMCGPC